MPNLKAIRPSTDLVGGTLYQAIRDPADHRRVKIISSNRENIDVDLLTVDEYGLTIHPDYLEDTKDGLRLITPPNLPNWSESSLSEYAKGRLAPTTLRHHFNAIRSYIANYVWMPDQIFYTLLSVAVLLSYLVRIFPAVPIFEVVGPVGSGKSTLFNVLSKICRSGIFSSISTIAGLARARHLNPCTLLVDEALRDPNHPVVLGSYKRGSTRLLAGPDQSLLEQNLFGLTFKVHDHASEAVKDRTIFIDIAPAELPMPPFLPERETERLSQLVDHSLWLSLTQHQNVLEQYELILKESPYSGRAIEKWAPNLAIARCIDASDTAQDPITPELEEMMAKQVANQKSERAATDPSLLALSGTLVYLEQHEVDLESTSVLIVASDLASFISEFAGTEMLPQRVSFLLGTNGVLSKTLRTRDTTTCVHPISVKHPVTVYEIDLKPLTQALAISGIQSDLDLKEKEKYKWNPSNEAKT